MESPDAPLDPSLSPMSVGELGRNLHEVKVEQREQRKALVDLKDSQITEKDLRLILQADRASEKVIEAEKREADRRTTFRWNVTQVIALLAILAALVAQFIK